MTVSGADAFFTKLDKFRRDALVPPGLTEMVKAVGEQAQKDADRALTADLGDTSMSHWRRGQPFDLKVESKLTAPTVVEVRPTGKGRGPWRVLEEGRKHGSAFDLVLVGRVRKKGRNAGTRRGKTRGRNQGATGAKTTWTEAVVEIDSHYVANVQGHLTKYVRRAE